MNVQIPQEQWDIVERMVAAGRFSSVEEAVAEGIRLLESAEQLRQQVQMGIEQADRGEVIEHDTVFAQLKAMAAATERSGQE
jgi:antitoxin ParD1/3/4